MRVARPDRLDLPRILAVSRRQRDAAGNEHARQMRTARQRHHHRGKPLVARTDADHAASRRERPDQPSQDERRVVAEREAVHHRGRPLRSAVARIGARAGERNGAEPAQLFGGPPREQPDLPVAGVVAEGERCAVRLADAALRAQNERLLATEPGRIPAHADVLAQREEVAARTLTQHLGGERQLARRTVGGRLETIERGGAVDEVGEFEGR